MTSALRLGMALLLCGGLLVSCTDDEGDAGADPGTEESSGEAATGDPITIGYANLEVAVPDNTIGVDVAAEYINTEMGGVNGRPIEYVKCEVDGSPETSIDCANRFVEDDVDLVQTAVDPGIDSALPILEEAGIPVVGYTPVTPSVGSDPNTVFFGTSLAVSSLATLQYFADSGAESVTFMIQDGTNERRLAEDIFAPAAETLGIDYQTVFYEANPDWGVVAGTAMADEPDAIGGPLMIDPDCIGLVGALRAAAYEGDIYAGYCSAFVEALGDGAAGVLTGADRWRTEDPDSAPEAKQAEIEQYVTAMTDAGQEEKINTFALFYFAGTIDLANGLSSISGTIDRDSVLEGLKGIVGEEAFMGPELTCDGSLVPDETICSTSFLLYEVTDDGGLAAATVDFIDAAGLLSS